MKLRLVLLFALRLLGLFALEPEKALSDAKQDEVQQLFESMLQYDLLDVDKMGRVVPKPIDYVLMRRSQGATATSLEIQDVLLHTYYYALPGSALQRWVEQWNQGRRFSAVRDNVQVISDWIANDLDQQSVIMTRRVPLEFGYLLNGVMTPGFNDWSVAAGDHDQVVFHQEFNVAQSTLVSLQVIGIPDISSLPQSSLRLRGCQATRLANNEYCKDVKASNAFAAWRLSFKIPKGKTHISLPVHSIKNPVADDRDLPIALDKHNKLVWKKQRARYQQIAGQRSQAARFVIKTSDNQSLTDASGSGEPTDLAIKLGLGGLLGYDSSYRYHLSGLIAQSDISDQGNVVLTLDSKLQAITQASLKKHLQKQQHKNKQWLDQRRAGVVILDVKTGAILAAAGHPLPQAGISTWDRNAFALKFSNKDPFRFVPWQGLDSHSTPGSTFKPVTALAAMHAAEKNAELKDMLKGVARSSFKTKVGLDPESRCYSLNGVASEVCNFSRYDLTHAFGKKLRAPECVNKQNISSHNMGLRESIRDSINIWYVKLAEEMDLDNLSTGGRDTYIYKTASDLGFGRPFSIFPDVGGLSSVNLSKAAYQARGSMLKAQTGYIDLGNKKLGSPEQRLSQNAFGQGASASILQMARVAGAVATGKIVEPQLLQAWDGDRVRQVAFKDLNVDEQLLDLLQQGMKAVPEVGTAKTAFKQHQDRCTVYGKTGTATAEQVVAHRKKRLITNTAWFIGWRDEVTTGEPDISFACSMTHLPQGNTGGAICAPIMAEILAQWRGRDVN